RVRLVVGRDPAGQVARRGLLQARSRPLDDDVPRTGVRTVHLEHALESAREVARSHDRAVRVLDASAYLEGVSLAAVRGLRDRGGEVWNELRPRRTADPFERDESVVRVDQE